MQLTTFSDYALRVLVYLALQPDRLATIAEIAESYNISENHLMKVVHHLAQTGYVETVRGKGGGLRLAGSPEEIGIGQVIRGTEGEHGLLECIGAKEVICCIQPSCRLMAILSEASAGMYTVLDKYTLSDLLKPKAKLEKLLDTCAAPHR
ncbi:MAG: Rrf2 family transcriptional regulator [Gammaproteobacteria bacterium]|nr:MAG: Rrf2 family transcriptional regulator [Gammaproteobacteria bacterium]